MWTRWWRSYGAHPANGFPLYSIDEAYIEHYADLAEAASTRRRRRAGRLARRIAAHVRAPARQGLSRSRRRHRPNARARGGGRIPMTTDCAPAEPRPSISPATLRMAETGAARASAAIPMAAILLARLTHAPNIQIAGEMFVNPRPRKLWNSMLDDRARGVRGLGDVPGTVRPLPSRPRLLLPQRHAGGRARQHQPAFRGRHHRQAEDARAGCRQHLLCRHVAAAHICTTAHSPRTFVEKVDFVTSPGFLDGPKTSRRPA